MLTSHGLNVLIPNSQRVIKLQKFGKLQTIAIFYFLKTVFFIQPLILTMQILKEKLDLEIVSSNRIRIFIMPNFMDWRIFGKVPLTSL